MQAEGRPTYSSNPFANRHSEKAALPPGNEPVPIVQEAEAFVYSYNIFINSVVNNIAHYNPLKENNAI
jgi:hypothetical protein